MWVSISFSFPFKSPENTAWPRYRSMIPLLLHSFVLLRQEVRNRQFSGGSSLSFSLLDLPGLSIGRFPEMESCSLAPSSS